MIGRTGAITPGIFYFIANTGIANHKRRQSCRSGEDCADPFDQGSTIQPSESLVKAELSVKISG